jgi:hypothetical protein
MFLLASQTYKPTNLPTYLAYLSCLSYLLAFFDACLVCLAHNVLSTPNMQISQKIVMSNMKLH